MKKLIYIIILIIATFAASCTDMYTNPKYLVLTTWKCTNFTDPDLASTYDYYKLKFKSTTSVEVWKKPKNADEQKLNNTYSYSIMDHIITIIVDNKKTITGTIFKNKITITDNGSTLVFVKP
jgi:hypothetical protein